MENELTHLENIIMETLQAPHTPLPPQRIQALQALIYTEKKRIPQVFLQVFLHGERKKKMERYIQFHQKQMVVLFNRLPVYSSTVRVSASERKVLELGGLIQATLLYLWMFVEQEFSEHRTLDLPVLAPQREAIVGAIIEELPNVEKALEVLKVEQVLKTIILSALQVFVNRTDEVYYQELYLMRDMTIGILRAAGSIVQRGLYTEAGNYTVVKLLCRLNFNHPDFYSYCKQHLRTYRNPQTDGNYDALYELTQVRRYLYRLKPKKAYCCQPEEPGIVVQLKDWLKSEIEIQKRLQAPATETTGVTDNSIIAAKVITTLTIPELALLLRLLIDVEVIRSKNWKSLARLVANNVGVSHKETKAAFSDDYLYNQMHSSTVLTIDKVQELWQKVFNRLTELRLEAKQVGKIH